MARVDPAKGERWRKRVGLSVRHLSRIVSLAQIPESCRGFLSLKTTLPFASRNILWESLRPMSSPTPGPASTRLFIVDSDTDFTTWAAAHLKADDVIIERFEKAEDALVSYAKNRADLVLTEARLPGISGIEFLKRLRQQDPNAMVLLFSGPAGTSAVIESMRLGAYDFVRKEQMPYDLRSLVESALRAVEGRRATLAAPVAVNTDSIQETIIG